MAAQQSNLPVEFNFGEITVRTFDQEGQVWFAAADVCAALDIANPRNATARLDDDEKGVHTVDTSTGNKEIVTINESGLYNLILTSRKESAKRFKKWVTGEVLPSIRTEGRYEARNQETEQKKLEQQPRMDEAHVRHCMSLANIYGAAAVSMLFNKFLTYDKDSVKHERFLVCFDWDMNPVVHPIERGAHVASFDRLAKMIVEPNGLAPSNVELANLAKACNERLAQRMEYQAREAAK